MAIELLPTNILTRARLLGRPFWQARYHDGREVSEWEVDWSLLPRRGLVAVRLVCPDGAVGVLGNSVDASDRLLQFKVGFADVSLDGPGGGMTTSAQVIGMLKDTSGTVQCWAWETNPGRLVGPFLDNWFDFRYGAVGPLSPEVLGVRPD